MHAWKLWLSKLKEIHLVQVQRCYHPDLLSKSIIRQVEVHTFVDASQEAFSAVTYLRVETRNENITSTLFGSKARVPPLKKRIISKLELQGCVLGGFFGATPRRFWPGSALKQDATRSMWLTESARSRKRQNEPTGDGFQQARILLI
ncbi:GAR1 [Cordylochernes scorpioides]|uniref:GAR1 n=1 Tax=Cordylochernes scorpioides TaxID=51811 RepID=A0ABY6L368_9ARAC|nr:GAR1 [Cordylochernes scorpioides]